MLTAGKPRWRAIAGGTAARPAPWAGSASAAALGSIGRLPARWFSAARGRARCPGGQSARRTAR